MKADIISTYLGSIICFEAGTKRGRKWLTANVLPDVQIVCDHRFAIDILQSALHDGMRIQDSTTGQVKHNG